MKNFGGGGMQNLIRQANQMQIKMGKLKEELATRTVEAKSGGGAVTAVATCNQMIQTLTIKKEAVDPSDVEMLQDLITTAVNDALKQAKETADKEMEKITGGMQIPGI